MSYSQANKLKKLADEKQVTVRQLCEQAKAEHKTELLAAMSLGVYPNTIRYHLAKPEPQNKTA
jgi:hypothetical protein